jgi:Ni/Fe-hydrogenase subunit HybB-like protein
MAYLIAGLVLASLASFVAIIAGTAFGVGAENGFSHGVWPVVLMLPAFTLPAAMLLTVALLVVGAVSRRRGTHPTH